jgi:hypothetical protein
MTKNKKLTFAWDIDRTLTLGDGWSESDCLNAVVNEPMKELINQAYENGHTIILYSSRRGSRRYATEFWLSKNDIRYTVLDIAHKLYVDYYIDDKAINASDLTKIKNVIK